MPDFDATNGRCFVYVFVEGLLSRVGHDLKLSVERFSVHVEDDRITATFDPRSLRVVAAQKNGRDDPSALGASDRAKIERNVRDDVLHPDRHPEIRFDARHLEETGGVWQVEGALTLHGTTRSIAFPVRATNDRLVASVTLHQPDFGIKPYRAALGGLRIKPEIVIEVSLPAPG